MGKARLAIMEVPEAVFADGIQARDTDELNFFPASILRNLNGCQMPGLQEHTTVEIEGAVVNHRLENQIRIPPWRRIDSVRMEVAEGRVPMDDQFWKAWFLAEEISCPTHCFCIFLQLGFDGSVDVRAAIMFAADPGMDEQAVAFYVMRFAAS